MKYSDVKFLSVDAVIAIHGEAIRAHGGTDGVRDRGLLESAINSARQTFLGSALHGSLAHMAAAYAYSISRNHAFVDGNKRAGLLAATAFLELNGHPTTMGVVWVQRMIAIQTNEATRDDLVRWFVQEMGRDEPVE